MKRAKRLLALLLAAVCLLAAAGCGGAPRRTGAAGRGAVVDLTDYTIVWPQGADDTLVSAALELQDALLLATGTQLPMTSDQVEDPSAIPVQARELVLGQTNRPEDAAIRQELYQLDYTVTRRGERYYITGGCEAATLEALQFFMQQYVHEDGVTLRERVNYLCRQQYPVESIRLQGVDLWKYRLVIPQQADRFAQYAAENFSGQIPAATGRPLPVVTDEEPETDYEILIGATNRAASAVEVPAGENTYILYRSGKKIVCLGDGYMVGGGVSELLSHIQTDGSQKAVRISGIAKKPVAAAFTFREAKNAVLLIGDGMGFNTVAMAEQVNGAFHAAALPNCGQAITDSLTTREDPDGKPTDSAAGGTALACGYKTYNGYAGLDGQQNAVQSLRELAAEKGCRTGVLTTDTITGATPAAFLAHCKDRNDTATIRDQITQLQQAGGVDVCAGDLGDGLRTATAQALAQLGADGRGFFLMVEEAYIDKSSHQQNAEACIRAMDRFDDLIAYVTEYVVCHPDTVLVVTADHETGGITRQADGSFRYTRASHSGVDVPIYAIGAGTEIFRGQTVQNTAIAKFLAGIYGSTDFGE